MDKRRVVISGIGLVTPLGLGQSKNWNNLISGVSGINSLNSFDASDLSCRIGGEIPSGPCSEGKLDLNEGMFRTAMDTGMEASTHIHDVASGEHEGIDPDAMRAIPVLKPPKRSFCPKCGSDIQANTMLQWRKWRDSASEVVSMQLEASMETALIHHNSSR